MLKTRDLNDVPALFELIMHPKVYPFVRHKPATSDEYYFMTKQTLQSEENGELISRTILDEYEQPIGTINLFDIENDYGFLATWIGAPYFGQGYNRIAKELFFNELFFDLNIETIFMKIRRANIRSVKAIQKLPYAVNGNALYPAIYEHINRLENVYELFAISKEHYSAYHQFASVDTAIKIADGEDVS